MEYYHYCCRWKKKKRVVLFLLHFYALIFFFFLFFLFNISTFYGLRRRAAISNPKSNFHEEGVGLSSGDEDDDDNNFQTLHWKNFLEGIGTRKLLGGLGSSPPRCASKCGGCSPCRAVHVAVPPGVPVTIMEYYPEAWRCKCGNRLYMPP